jgi:hypothetical protein
VRELSFCAGRHLTTDSTYFPTTASRRTDKPPLLENGYTNRIDDDSVFSMPVSRPRSYVMEHVNKINSVHPIASVLKKCPCCSSLGLMTKVAGQQKFGIRCTGCPVGISEVCDTPDSALAVWFRRKGTASAAAGRAGKGKCSWRKRRSCRRNARLARQNKEKKRIRAYLLTITPWVWALRGFEWASSDEAKARAWALLRAMEPQVMRFPSLRPFCKVLRDFAPLYES